MMRQIGLSATFILGLMAGSALPLALAHPEEECVCVCPECPPPMQDHDGDGIPDTLDVDVGQEDEEAIKKALDAIKKAEEHQQQVQQQVQQQLPTAE